jgi:hypothetical protein
MPSDELLEYIRNKAGFLPEIFSRWTRSSVQFREFAIRNKDAICKKFAEARKEAICKSAEARKNRSGEKLKDVLFELKIAYLIRDRLGFLVEYEPFGDDGGPDFAVINENNLTFYVEVKYIRETDGEIRLKRWRSEVAREVRGIPSTLAVSLNIGLHIEEITALLNLLTRLENRKPEIIEWIKGRIRTEEYKIPIGGSARFSDSESGLELVLRKPQGKLSSNCTTFNGGIFPVFLKNQEWQKFKDLIFPRRDQRIPEKINVLAICTANATHDKDDLIKEIESDFAERVAQGNVTEQMKKLSGILFVGAWEGEDFLWLNPIACCSIPKGISDALDQLLSETSC